VRTDRQALDDLARLVDADGSHVQPPADDSLRGRDVHVGIPAAYRGAFSSTGRPWPAPRPALDLAPPRRRAVLYVGLDRHRLSRDRVVGVRERRLEAELLAHPQPFYRSRLLQGATTSQNGGSDGGSEKKRAAKARVSWLDGGEEEDRTPDLRIANATLSQLSYPPHHGRQSTKRNASPGADFRPDE
jgi:hypothetical protein